MKLTSREKLMLKIVGIAAMVALTYYFVIMPEIGKLNEIGDQLIAKDLEVSTIKKEIASISTLEEEINSINEDLLEDTKQFYPDLIQKKLIVILDKIFEDAEISPDSISFSQINIVSAEASSENTSGLEGAPVVKSMSVTMPLSGTYQQIMKLVHELEAMERVNIINSLQLANGEDNQITGGINIDFYAISKNSINPKDEEYMKWPYNSPHGISNPFEEKQSQPPIEENSELPVDD